MILNRIGPMSCAKVAACVYAGIGLIAGLIISIVSLIGAGIAADEGGLPALFFGVGAIIFLPLFYGVVGFLAGLIGSSIYNLAARFVGGLELDLS